MEYRTAEPADYESIRRFLAENGWETRVEDVERFLTMIQNATRTVVASEAGQIAGFARCLTDGVSNGYIGTVAVAEKYRGRGIGRKMVERLMGNDQGVTWALRSGRGSNEFWRKMGFTESSVAMERIRQ